MQFVQKHRCTNSWQRFILGTLFLIASFISHSQLTAHAEPVPLHLEVHVNGHSTQLIAAFEQHEDGRFSTALSELQELGLKPNGANVTDGKIYLEEISGLSYKYDEATQKLYVDTDNSNRTAKDYSANLKGDKLKISESNFGAVVNYAINASGTSNLNLNEREFEGLSALFDGRTFGPYGVLSSSFIVNSKNTDNGHLRRLTSSWSYSDHERLITYTVGDIVSGGPSWARPVRLGGVRINRNFSIRPDLITAPVAQVSGTAAVPSTVDVYVNNVKAHSQNVSPGPFTLSNIPSISGNGTARVVVRDETGRETVTYNDFYVSPHLLADGLWDFSAELGVARGNYGQKSFDYDTDPYLSGNVRYGWQNIATLDGHVETGLDLLLAGGGVTLPIANKALISVSGAGSFHKSGSGFLAAASLETNLFGLTVNARSQRSFGDFKDIAAVTASKFAKTSSSSANILSATDFPTAIDQISIGVPFPKWKASFNTSFIHTDTKGTPANNILSGSFSKTIFSDSSFYATAFADVKDLANPSVFVGLSVPLGKLGTVSGGGAFTKGQGWRATTTYSKPLSSENNSLGWRIQDQEGETSVRNAAVSYRSPYATIEGRVAQTGKAAEYSGFAEGAVVASKAGVFAANRIDDSFAIVDVGAPNVPVTFQNRLVGKTNSSGTLLIPGLHSYDRNKIAIDPTELPVNANIPKTTQTIVPSYRSGVIVNFGVKEKTSSAIVIVHDTNGTPLKVGTEGKIGKNANAVVMGFDGRVFVEELSSSNIIHFETESGACRAEFDYQAQSNTQIEIGPVICQ